MFNVKDGLRTLQFEGNLLGSSTSKRSDSTRWIEFELYKTESGSYVLSRIGVSLVFNGAACSLVKRYSLQESPISDLNHQAIPCDQCDPDESAGLVFPEKYRHWAQVSDKPEAVLEALYKFDDYGTKYLTSVAQRLLEAAAKLDSDIANVYNYEIIPQGQINTKRNDKNDIRTRRGSTEPSQQR